MLFVDFLLLPRSELVLAKLFVGRTIMEIMWFLLKSLKRGFVREEINPFFCNHELEDKVFYRYEEDRVV
jgi:hypothetical protein